MGKKLFYLTKIEQNVQLYQKVVELKKKCTIVPKNGGLGAYLHIVPLEYNITSEKYDLKHKFPKFILLFGYLTNLSNTFAIID